MIDKLKDKINTWIRANKMSPFPVVDTGIIKDGIKLILIMTKQWNNKKEDYNNVPVTYCNNCLSLKGTKLPNSNIEYCLMCGDTDSTESHIEEWDKKYKEMYGKSFIERDRNDKPVQGNNLREK